MAITQALIDELAKPEYVGMSSKARYELLTTQTLKLVDRLLPDVVPEITEILGDGFRRRLNAFIPTDNPLPLDQQQQILDKLAVAFEPSWLNSDRFVIHLGLPEHRQALDAAVLIGIITVEWRDKFLKLATRDIPAWPNVTLRDVVEITEPALLDGTWHEIEPTNLMTLRLQLRTAAPEQTYIVVQAQDQYDDGTVSDWYHATALHGITSARQYQAALPHNGYPRKLRWKCEYLLGGEVTAV